MADFDAVGRNVLRRTVNGRRRSLRYDVFVVGPLSVSDVLGIETGRQAA
jgi:hypothetical protein